MLLTLRLKDDRYVDILYEPAQRELSFLSPIPELELKDLCKLSDETCTIINLPITEERIIPETKVPDHTSVQTTLLDLLKVLCYFGDYVISEG